MARVLLVALAWCAVRGEEYGGGAMPQYGADYRALADDYRGHSPDAPASLDYKYEEPQGETEKPPKYVDDSDSWRKSARRRTSRKDVNIKMELRSEDADGEAASETSRRRWRRNRPRGRLERSRRDEQTARRRAAADATRFGLPEHYLDNIDYPDDRRKNLKENDPIPPRDTTARANRRKSRKRMFAPPPPAAGKGSLGSLIERNSVEMTELEDEELVPNRLMKEDRDDKLYDMDFWKSSEEGERAGSPLQAPLPGAPETDVDDTLKRKQGRTKYPSYQDYTDYYDIKQRINSIIKNKLPKLHRTGRPTTTRRLRVLQRTTTKYRRRLWAPAGGSPRLDFGGAPAGASRRFEYDFGGPPRERFNLALASGSRRLDYDLASGGGSPRLSHLATDGGPVRTDFDLTTSGGTSRPKFHLESFGGSQRKDYGIAPSGGTRRLDHDLAPIVILPRPDFDLGPSVSSPRTDLDFTATHTSVATDTNNATAIHSNATEPSVAEKFTSDTKVLSLAEKSRLSILKKVLMKDKLKNPASSKPAVLLRMTSHLPTVVMVVPATSTEPWMRAHEVAGDSPATLEKVKQLMRKKLVASAKSIRELTDDWDEPVCDYIDMSMLEPLGAGARAHAAPPPLAVLLAALATSLLVYITPFVKKHNVKAHPDDADRTAELAPLGASGHPGRGESDTWRQLDSKLIRMPGGVRGSAADSVAERELHALLGSYRLRKEAPTPPPPPARLAPPPPPLPTAPVTLPPASVDTALAEQWRRFVASGDGAGGARCPRRSRSFSLYVPLFVVINSFIRL